MGTLVSPILPSATVAIPLAAWCTERHACDVRCVRVNIVRNDGDDSCDLASDDGDDDWDDDFLRKRGWRKGTFGNRRSYALSSYLGPRSPRPAQSAPSLFATPPRLIARTSAPEQPGSITLRSIPSQSKPSLSPLHPSPPRVFPDSPFSISVRSISRTLNIYSSFFVFCEGLYIV